MRDALASFHFLRPFWLVLAVPFLLLAGAELVRRRQGSPWAKVIAPHLLAHLTAPRRGARAGLTPELLLIPFGLLAAIAAAGPTWSLRPSAQGPDDSALILVVELSSSMDAKDISPSRVGRARLELRDLLAARGGGDTGLVVVAGTAHVLMPLTDDPAVLEPYVTSLEPSLMPQDGQSFAAAARRVEEVAARARGAVTTVLVTDGLDPEGVEAFTALQKRSGMALVVWSVGTTDGTPPLDEGSLDALARQARAERVDLSLGERDVARILAVAQRQRAQRAAPADASLWDDAGYTLAFPLVALAAFWFRRGWALRRAGALALFVLFTSGCEGSFADLWLTPDEQGRVLFDRGHFAEAAARFHDPMWKGIAYYAAGDWTHAAASFAMLDTKEGLFNLGNAYAQGGRLGSALRAYERALAKSPSFRPARQNADLVRELLGSLREDTDAEDAKKGEPATDDEAVRLRPEELATQEARPQPMGAAPEDRAGEELAASESDAWMRRVSTNPADFLRRKLAVLAARGQGR